MASTVSWFTGQTVVQKLFDEVAPKFEGRNGGYTAEIADACVLVPTVNPETVTPHTESFQALVWHLLVSHPALKVAEMKWESVV